METKLKLDNLSKMISDAVQKAVSASESKHLNILEEIDNRIHAEPGLRCGC